MKAIIILLATFALAFLSTLLFEIPFISKNPVRVSLVVLLTVCILGGGYWLLKAAYGGGNEKPENE